MKITDQNLIHLCDALAVFLAPFGEVVLHNLETETIAHISGKLSNRKIGDPSFLDDLDIALSSDPVFGPYSKTNPDGRLIKSISILFRDETEKPMTLLCINMDTSHFSQASAIISQFITVPESNGANPFADDWLDKLNTFVAEWNRSEGLSSANLTPKDRRRLISILKDKGVFGRPKAVDAVAAAISVSRATIYQDLREI